MVHHYFVVPMPFSYEEPCFPTHLKNYFPFLSPWTNNQLDQIYGHGHGFERGNFETTHRRRHLSELENSVHATLTQLSFPEPKNLQLGELQCPTVSVELKREPGSGTDMYTMAVPLGSNVQPDNLKVSLNDTIISVEGTTMREGTNSEGHHSQFSENFTKKITLPSNVNLKKVKVHFNLKDYLLKIEAPLIQHQQLSSGSSSERQR